MRTFWEQPLCLLCPTFARGLRTFLQPWMNFRIGFLFRPRIEDGVTGSSGRWSWSSRTGLGWTVRGSPLSVTWGPTSTTPWWTPMGPTGPMGWPKPYWILKSKMYKMLKMRYSSIWYLGDPLKLVYLVLNFGFSFKRRRYREWQNLICAISAGIHSYEY